MDNNANFLILYIVILFAIVALRVGKGFFQFYIAWLWFIKKHKNIRLINNAQKSVRFIILIPVLREQNVINQTLIRFASLRKVEKIIFITTEKEYLEKGEHKETTFDILQRKKDRYSNVEVIHYPYTTGVMAHQLNYACKILETRNYDGFVLIYNADSVVYQDSIDGFQNYIHNHSSAKVIQQSAVFIDNYDRYPSSFRGDILKATALYQSRWTFAYELYRLRNQLEDKNKWFQECGHVVGHGLCIRFKTLADIEYFPSDVPNEDMSLGFLLRLKNEKIHVLPIIEIGESPRTIKAIIAQYTSWFYGVIYYPVYFRIALKKNSKKWLKALTWSILNTSRALIWLFTTYVWIFLFIVFALINWILFMLAIILFAIYSIGNNYLVLVKLKKLTPMYFVNKTNIKRHIGFAAASMLVYLFQSIGPTIAVKNMIVSKTLNGPLKKEKVER